MRERVLRPAVKRADERLARAELAPLPDCLTPHSLHRTFTSMLAALGDDPRQVRGQLGCTDPALTLRLYAQEMDRDDGERDRLRAESLRDRERTQHGKAFDDLLNGTSGRGARHTPS